MAYETAGSEYLRLTAASLNLLTSRIVDCLGRLSEEQVWLRHHENENAVGNLVVHLSGSLQQWILTGLGGRPDARQRDQEFALRGGVTIPDLKSRLEDTVRTVVSLLGNFPEEKLNQSFPIRGRELSGMEVIFHVTEHVAQHAGQIVFATKLLTGQNLGYPRYFAPGGPRGGA
jgi:uncharacterized damage-inducible protein DinB